MLRAALESADFEVLRAFDETATINFAGSEQWWEQRMAIPQLLFEKLAPESQQQFKAEMLSVLASMDTRDGLPETRTAVYAVAVKPA